MNTTRYLIDTHILLWASSLDNKLPKHIYDILYNADIEIAYSVICLWELIIKEAKGKLNLPDNFFARLPELGFSCLDVKQSHVLMLQNIPSGHGDPFDRMLIAQAKAENITLITHDKQLSQYPAKLLII